MKKKSIVKSVWILTIGLLAVTSCQPKGAQSQDHDDPYALEIDSSLAVLLKPTNQEVVSSVPVLKAQSGARLFSMEVAGRISYDRKNQSSLASRVSGRIERIDVKYNYQPVKKGQLIMEIYSPDLAAAQRELLMILASGGKENELLEKAKQRLFLLGMSSAAINTLISTKEVTYRVPVYSNASGYLIEPLTGSAGAMEQTQELTSNSPIMLRQGQYITAGETLFTLYKSADLLAEFSVPPAFSQEVKAGTSILIQSPDAGATFKAKIALIEPLVKNGERFSTARVYLSDSGLRAGQLVKGIIPVFIKKGWWVPQKAVWQSGTAAIVFKKEKGVFVPKNVKVGVILNGQVQLLDDIRDWEIASNAYYLVDSESFIRPQNSIE